MAQTQAARAIPTQLSLSQFEEFVLPHLPTRGRGPQPKLSSHQTFNYILKLLYLGCQWKELPIKKGLDGLPEIHYTRVYRAFRSLVAYGTIEAVFGGSVSALRRSGRLDLSVIHGDGTTTAAKKGGDNLGFSGHKHVKGDKIVGFCDRNCNVVAPFVTAPGNCNESSLLPNALKNLTDIARTIGLNLVKSVLSLDGAYDSRLNRKAIFNRGMVPNIHENQRNRVSTKRGRKRFFNQEIFDERFATIERVFGWEDKFRRLLIRFERISKLHYAFKLLAYTMINLRNFPRG
jgi:transposase